MASSDDGKTEVFQTPLKTPRTRFCRREAVKEDDQVSIKESPSSPKSWRTPSANLRTKTNEELTSDDVVSASDQLGTPTALGLSAQRDLIKSERRYRMALQDVVFEQNKNKELNRELDTKNAHIDQLQDEMRLKEELDVAHKRRESEFVEEVNKLKSDMNLLDASRRAMEAQLRKKSEQNGTLLTKIRTLENQVSHYKERVDEAKEEERRRSDEARQRDGVLAKRETELAAIDLVKLGSVTATNEFLNKQVAELKQREEELTALLDSAREQARTSKEDLDSLQKKLVDMEGDTERTHQYLLSEIEKIKKEKAELRCELLAARRDNGRLRDEVKKLQIVDLNQSKVDAMEERVRVANADKQRAEKHEADLRARVVELEDRIAELKALLNDLNEKSDEVSVVSTEREELRRRLKVEDEKNMLLVRGLADLNEQYEYCMRQRKRFEDRLQRAQSEIVDVNAKLREKDRELEGVKKGEAEVAALRAENDRLQDKVAFLQEEIQELHTDYREELARFARQCSENSGAANICRGELQSKMDELKRANSQVESQVKALKRQLDESRQESKRTGDQLTEANIRERATNEENAKLRQGLLDAIGKGEKYKNESTETTESLQLAQDELVVLREKTRRLETEVQDLDEVIKEKERLIIYLQSQTNAQKMPKVKSKATLLLQPSDSSLEQMDMEVSEVIELENMRKRLRDQLDKKREELNARKGSTGDVSTNSVTSSENVPPTPQYATPQRITKTPLASQNSAPEIGNPQMSATPHLQKSKTVGKMRHDIPHKWRQQFGLAVRQMKCCICFEGIPRMGHAMRCTECDVVVHRRCVPRVTNTCGFPMQYAAFYHDSQAATTLPTADVAVGGSTSSGGVTMNGRVRIYRGSQPQWRSAFALMEHGKLCFYNDEGLAGNLEKSFLTLDLEKEPWSVRVLGEGPNGERDGFANCIQIRSNGETIYMLCPTDNCTARWTASLQAASRRRHFMTRRPSQFSTSSLLLALDTPNNLNINTALVFDDWLLIGAQEGLFATQLNDPRSPFMISCGGAVHALVALGDLGFVACVMGKNRQLGLLSSTQLRLELTRRQPTLRPQDIAGMEHIHLIEYHCEGQQKYLLAADTQSINVLQYKRDFFTAHMAIGTNEPVTCILSAHGGFYYGADSFYFAHSLYSGQPQVRPLASHHVADYPLSVLETGNDEVLLAYQNYGVFVNSRGEKTREKIVEWEQTPMEFAFTAPYLYVVHFDSLEIMQVYENEGSKSPTVSEEREVYGAKQARLVGNGASGEVLVALSSAQRVELHAFNAIANKRSGSKRRALANAFGSLDKRSRMGLSKAHLEF